MTRTHLFAAVALVIAALLGSFYWYATRPEFDSDLRDAFAQSADVFAYVQEDMTETIISDRTLRIEGTYRNDARTNRYASIATTTISIPDEGEHAFALENISLGETVFTRVVTTSPLLAKQIAFDSTWHQFRSDAIAAEFENVAIAGPILDHLQLFSSDGSHLDIIDGPAHEDVGSEELTRYTFRLASQRPQSGGTLATLMDRIGDGEIRIWIDADKNIRRIVIDNDPFHSTTTLSRFNESLRMEAPPIIE